MKRTCVVAMGAKSIMILVEGDSADDVFDAFTTAMRDAGKAVKRGKRIDESRQHKSATVKLNVDPGDAAHG